MHWNPYIDLRVAISRAVRAKCKLCGVEIGRGDYRAEAIPIMGKIELLHVDCAAKKLPDHAKRKVKDKPSDWPAEALAVLERYLRDDVEPAPRSYQVTPIQDLSYGAKLKTTKPCEWCGIDCPAPEGVGAESFKGDATAEMLFGAFDAHTLIGHPIRAFSLDGERRFHPVCILQLAPGLCKRVVSEDSELWPADVKGLFLRTTTKVDATPRSPWRNAAGIPKLQHSPSGRAACRFCKEKIGKGELRLAREQLYGMRRSPVYFHVGCYATCEDFHPKMLELIVLKAEPDITREEIAELPLPPTREEDDDVTPLKERLLTLYDLVPRKTDEGGDDSPSGLSENVVHIPEGFFNT